MMLTFKRISFQISQLFNIVLKSLHDIDPFRADVTITSQRKTKRKLEAANSNQRRFVNTRSLKHHFVVILGARIDVVEASIRFFKTKPDKTQ